MMNKESLKILDFDFVKDKLIVHSPYGEEMKRHLSLFDPAQIPEIEAEYDLIDSAMDYMERYRYELLDARHELKNIKDLRGSFDRLANGEILSVTELFEIKHFVLTLKRICQITDGLKPALPEAVKVFRILEIETLLDPEKTGGSTFYIYDGYDDGLKAVRHAIREAESQIARIKKEGREAIESRYGIKTKAHGEITVAKHDKTMLERMEQDPALVYTSENMMYRNFKVLYGHEAEMIEEALLDLKCQEEILEFKVCKALSHELKSYVDSLYLDATRIGKFDFILSKAYFAVGYNAVRPEISQLGKDSETAFIAIEEGRYIKVENQLRAQGKTYTPVSIHVKSGVTCITGANMGGKTITLKMLGQLLLMAQSGLFVPAGSMAFTPIDRVSLIIGDSQNVDQGLSTFGAEIVAIKRAVDESKVPGLILIDELARGTNPKEGYAISKSIIEHLTKMPAISVITTHFDGLADDDDVNHLQVMGLKKAALEKVVHDGMLHEAILNDFMDYRLKKITDLEEVPKDAVNISEILGLNSSIVARAREIINSIRG